ncbi:unnamed protein product [Rotaria sp. Silwood2]|nr:unnamed protein product [Rotaria sp. Silwood2]
MHYVLCSSLTVGASGINVQNNIFDGCLDSMAYFAQAKKATEVLDDATNVAYLSFDNNNLLDSGPLLINGTGMNYSFTSSGRVKQCLTLSGTSSYVQITGLRRLGINDWPYTFAIWIYPKINSFGTIIYLSIEISPTTPTFSWCLPVMGFTSSGHVSINCWGEGIVSIIGPSIPLLAWTHVAVTYSSNNGQRLYINGTQYGSLTAAFDFVAGGVPMSVTLGSSLGGTNICQHGAVVVGQYQGSLDEFRVYARELAAAEVAQLSNS